MTTFKASAKNLRTGYTAERNFTSAELAARHLLMLMAMDGWSGDQEKALDALMKGEPLTHKGFEYRARGER